VKEARTERGLELELESAKVVFWTRVNIPLNVCSSLEFNASVTVLEGQVEASLDVDFRDYQGTDLDNLSLYQNIVLSPTNNTDTLSLSAPLVELLDRVSHFSVSSHVRLEIASESSSRLILGNVSVEGTATQELCKISIDMQALDGASINSNPNAQWLLYLPFLNLTKQGSSESWALFPITRPNEVLYLQPGQYIGIAGWIWLYHFSYRFSSEVNVNLTIEANEKANWNIRIHCTRVYFTLEPTVPEIAVWIFYGSDYILWASFNMSVSDYIYLPLESEPVYYSIRIYTNPANQYSYRRIPHVREARGYFDSESEWLVETTLPMTEFLGVYLRQGDVVLVSLGTILLALMIVKILFQFEVQGYQNVLRDPRLLPFIILCTTIFLPWAEFSRTSSWNVSDSSVNITKMSPLALLLMWSSGSDVIVQPGLYWYEYIGEIRVLFDATALLLSSILLFWIPLGYILSRIREDNQLKDEVVSALALLGPILLVLMAYIPNEYVTFEGLSIGSYIAATAFPLFLIFYIMQRIQERKSREN
jgi:hypothetical protein